jgi:hypothetical protein
MKQFRKLEKKKRTQEEASGFERVLLLFTPPVGLRASSGRINKSRIKNGLQNGAKARFVTDRRAFGLYRVGLKKARIKFKLQF